MATTINSSGRPRYSYRTPNVSVSQDLSSYQVTRLMDWIESDENKVEFHESGRFRGDEYGEFLIDPSYETTNKKAFQSQADCAIAWEEKQFPAHNVSKLSSGGFEAELYSSPNYRARQFAEGHGRITHYRTICAIRTRNDLVIANSQDHGGGFAYTTYPEYDHYLPLTGIEQLLEDGEDLYDIVDVHGMDRMNPSKVPNATVVELESGAAIVTFSTDYSSKESPAGYGFRVTPEEFKQSTYPNDLMELLVPREVRKAAVDYEVVTTDQMVPGYGNTRYDDRGDVIQRQGEWFFIPCDEPEPEHVEIINSRIPRTCGNCGESRFNVDPETTTCKECDTVHVREPLLTDKDRKMGNHRPTTFLPASNDSVTADGGLSEFVGYVKGTVRHTAEHYMARLGDQWHRAVRHTRDVLQFDPRPGDTGRSSRGGWD